MHSRRGIRVPVVVTCLALVVIAVATLSPQPQPEEPLPHLCLVCGELGGTDVILNILLYMPLGIGLTLSGLPKGRALLMVVLLTVTVETLQLGVIPGRNASISDVLTNSSGGLAGIALGRHWRSLIRPGAALSMTLLCAASVLAIAVTVVGAWGVQPLLPQAQYEALWAPDLPHIELFTGHVLAARLNGLPVSNQTKFASSSVRASLVERGIQLEASTTTDRPTYGLAPIFCLSAPTTPLVAVIGQDGHSLVFRINLRSSSLKMRTPVASLAFFSGSLGKAGPTSSHDTVLVAGGIQHDALWVVGRRGERASDATLRLSPFIAWMFILPWDFHATRFVAALSLLWVCAVFFPVGFFAGAAGVTHLRKWSSAMIAVVTVFCGLCIVPLLFGFGPAPLLLWLGATLVIAGALFLGVRIRCAQSIK